MSSFGMFQEFRQFFWITTIGRGFLKWWVSPTTMGFPTYKWSALGVWNGEYHHFSGTTLDLRKGAKWFLQGVNSAFNWHPLIRTYNIKGFIVDCYGSFPECTQEFPIKYTWNIRDDPSQEENCDGRSISLRSGLQCFGNNKMIIQPKLTPIKAQPPVTQKWRFLYNL